LGQKHKPETRGFCGLPNPGFGFGKMSGFPRAPGFSKPGFQSLVPRYATITGIGVAPNFKQQEVKHFHFELSNCTCQKI